MPGLNDKIKKYPKQSKPENPQDQENQKKVEKIFVSEHFQQQIQSLIFNFL